jgi:adenylyltransferase/sulfurtransferase
MNYDRYNRQIILPNFGTEAQEKLSQAKVLVVGAGGLGCPVLQFLTAAGVGNLGIVDFDTVTISNLQRQILFDESSAGRNKAIAAKEKLQQLNSEITITAFPEKITPQNALNLLENYDIAVGCTDNFQSRYLLNDACCSLDKPLVYGAIYQYEGQVSVFNVEQEGIKTNYRDLFPQLPRPENTPNPNQLGVLGTLTGIIGTLQAQEVIKLITGIGDVLAGKLLMFNILTYQIRIMKYGK